MLHHHFKTGYKANILGMCAFSEIERTLKDQLNPIDYKKFSIWKIFRIGKGAILISHNRHLTALLVFLKKMIKPSLKIIHVAHNEFHNRKHLILYPSSIVAVSHRVKKNLTSYYQVPEDKVRVIYNGIPDSIGLMRFRSPVKTGIVNILYPARITNVKNQLEVVRKLKNEIPENIHIHFAGEGPDFETLRDCCKDTEQFKVLGYIDNLLEIYPEYQYVMLFSKQEGLPIVLIEALMMGIPIICNDVGGNREIVGSENGFLVNDFKTLIHLLREIPIPLSPSYRHLSMNARKTYEDNFTLEKMYEGYDELLQKVSEDKRI
jgi:glycosyltransferase involved in cell wall biosynthesis